MSYGDRIGSRISSASKGAKYTSSQVSSNRKKAGIGALATGAIGAVGLYALSNVGNKSNKGSSSGSSGSSSSSSGASSSDGTSTGSSGSSDSGDGSDSSKTKKQVVEIPIDNYDDALKFALNEWHKIRRDDGRQVECGVLGATNWKCGEWSKVILPSYEINEYMYISRVSQNNEGGEWTGTITLVDYPPGWGEETLETTEDDESSEEEDETSADEEEDDDESTSDSSE